uniref:growth-regulated alpha protein-like isoform X1 n=1 Tax=Gasterosteus aculeatus aculeatus TaxID=481459 RepID=UPI001A97E75E|nr:growth-regulated alpha protein-like isoform X1 [Gasterosteus aculeatus aculeatus]
MSGIMKVFLLLAVMFCISEAQLDHTSGNQCLCANVQRGIQRGTKMKDIQIQIYPPSVFCDKVEIVVNNNNGRRYCLNPELKPVQRLIARIMKPAPSTATRPTELN